MLVSHSHKFIFIKTKKTAGSTIEKIITENFFNPKIDICTGSIKDFTPRTNIDIKTGHMESSRAKKYVTPDQWKEYHKFAVERNPWDKVVSQYFWKIKKYKKPLSFETWLQKGQLIPRDWNLYTENDKVVLDQIIQFNTLHEELIDLFNNKLNLALTQEMLDNTTVKVGFRKKHYTEMYTEQSMIDNVAKKFKKEIKYFDYKYGD